MTKGRHLLIGRSTAVGTFRGGDDLRFLLDEGPAFIRLDEVSGKMVLAPEARDVGTHTVTVNLLCSIGELQAQSGAQGVGRYDGTFLRLISLCSHKSIHLDGILPTFQYALILND